MISDHVNPAGCGCASGNGPIIGEGGAQYAWRTRGRLGAVEPAGQIAPAGRPYYSPSEAERALLWFGYSGHDLLSGRRTRCEAWALTSPENRLNVAIEFVRLGSSYPSTASAMAEAIRRHTVGGVTTGIGANWGHDNPTDAELQAAAALVEAVTQFCSMQVKAPPVYYRPLDPFTPDVKLPTPKEKSAPAGQVFVYPQLSPWAPYPNELIGDCARWRGLTRNQKYQLASQTVPPWRVPMVVSDLDRACASPYSTYQPYSLYQFSYVMPWAFPRFYTTWSGGGYHHDGHHHRPGGEPIAPAG